MPHRSKTPSRVPFNDDLEALDDAQLSTAVGGFHYWSFAKNVVKAHVNGFIDYQNAILPDQVGGFASYNIPKIPTPFHDNPAKKGGRQLHDVLFPPTRGKFENVR